MKVAKITLLAFLAAFVAVGMSTTSHAFHSGGVAECEGCHSMHSPGKQTNGVGDGSGSFLLVGQDQSSACLTCHQSNTDTGPSSYHISTVETSLGVGQNPLQRTPGGDFGWLKKTYSYSYTSGGITTNFTETGSGHNIIAGDFGYGVDPDRATAPGGSFPSAQLACNSCHDPHGQYRRLSSGNIAKTGEPIWASGSYFNPTAGVAANEPKATVGSEAAVGVYRLLAGAGYTKDGVTFNGVPAAKVPSTYNRTEASTQTRTVYGVATGGGHVKWGSWCATCHPDMHSVDNGGNYVHPTDESLGSVIAGLYNQYVKSGVMTGTAASSFLSLVPFATDSPDYTVLAPLAVNNDTALAGPGQNDEVTCLSCHRAHASGFAHALRFDQGYEFMTKNGLYIGSDNPEVGTTGRGPLQSRGRTIADWKAAYYDRPESKFASYQRVLCNKCHAKD